MNISFDALTGDQWYFHPPSAGKGYAGQVTHWAKVSKVPLTFNYKKVGHDNAPCWIAQPQLAGEPLPFIYFGYGTAKKRAKEDACHKMAESGHCVITKLLVLVSPTDTAPVGTLDKRAPH